MIKSKLPILTSAIVVCSLVVIWGVQERRAGARDEKAKVRDVAIDTLQARKVRVDTVWTHDTVRLTRWRTAYDTTRDTVLLHLSDTVRVKEFVHVADSTIRACSVVVVDCEARVAVRDSLIDSLRIQLAAERRKDRLPLFHVKLPSRKASLGLGVAAGLAAGLLLRK